MCRQQDLPVAAYGLDEHDLDVFGLVVSQTYPLGALEAVNYLVAGHRDVADNREAVAETNQAT